MNKIHTSILIATTLILVGICVAGQEQLHITADTLCSKNTHVAVPENSDAPPQDYYLVNDSKKILAGPYRDISCTESGDVIYTIGDKISQSAPNHLELFENRNWKTGLLDSKGKVIVNASWRYLERTLVKECFLIGVDFDNANGLLCNHKDVVKPSSELPGIIDVKYSLDPSIVLYSTEDQNYETNDYALNLKTGTVHEATAEELYSWGDSHEGRLAKSKDGKWGFINSKLNFVIPAVYDSVSYFSNGFALAWKDNKRMYLDTNGVVLGGQKYENAFFFSEGSNLGLVKQNGLWYFINKQGKNTIGKSFSDAYAFTDSIAEVKVKDLWGAIDTKGKFVVTPQLPTDFEISLSDAGTYVVTINSLAYNVLPDGSLKAIPESERSSSSSYDDGYYDDDY